jgi:hypothetical protein
MLSQESTNLCQYFVPWDKCDLPRINLGNAPANLVELGSSDVGRHVFGKTCDESFGEIGTGLWR